MVFFLLDGRPTPLLFPYTTLFRSEAPVQALEAVKNVNVTVPVGVPKLPLAVALSCTVDPAGTEVTTAWLASWISGAADGATAVTATGSHGRPPVVESASPP